MPHFFIILVTGSIRFFSSFELSQEELLLCLLTLQDRVIVTSVIGNDLNRIEYRTKGVSKREAFGNFCGRVTLPVRSSFYIVWSTAVNHQMSISTFTPLKIELKISTTTIIENSLWNSKTTATKITPKWPYPVYDSATK